MINKFKRYTNNLSESTREDGTPIAYYNDSFKIKTAALCAMILMDELINYSKSFGDVTKSDVEEFMKIRSDISGYLYRS